MTGKVLPRIPVLSDELRTAGNDLLKGCYSDKNGDSRLQELAPHNRNNKEKRVRVKVAYIIRVFFIRQIRQGDNKDSGQLVSVRAFK